MNRTQRVLLVTILLAVLFPAECANAFPVGTEEPHGWRREHAIGRNYDPLNETLMEGTVVAVEMAISARRQAHSVQLLLETDGGLIRVHLGPLSFLQGLGKEIETGDQVSVKGSLVTVGEEEVLIAARLSYGSKSIELRDTRGVPVWSGWRAGGAEEGLGCAIYGAVCDTSGAGVPGAVVVLEPSAQSVTTNEDGSFCFPHLDPLTAAVSVNAPGFQGQRTDLRVSNQPVMELNLILFPAIIEETVTVMAATRTVKSLDEVPVRTEVVLPELMELSASRNLADALEFSPGIRVESNCQNCNFSQIRMLGLQGPYTQILFDGQPTMSSLAQVYGIEQIPSRMVERIEVVKGGGSSIYGPGSVGGVVNIVSHVPSRTTGYLLARTGWMNGVPNQTFSASADWASSNRDSAVTIFGQGDKVNPVDVDRDGFTEVSKRDFRAMGGRFRRNFLDQKGELTVDFNRFREKRRGGDRLDLPPERASLAEAVESTRSAGGVGWHHTPSAAFDYRLALSVARMDRDTYYGSGQDPNAFGTSRNPLWVVDSQFNHFLGSHILSWGGQITSDGIEDVQPAYERSYDETYRNFGGFIQDDWFLLPGLELVWGGRLDKHSAITGPVFSPRLALMWTANPDLHVRTSVATGFLAPRVFDEDLHITVAGGKAQVIRNAADLKEESSTTLMAGAEWKPRWGDGGGLVEVNLFRTTLKNLFNVVEDDLPETEEMEFTRVNFGTAKVYGAEINLGYVLNPSIEIQVGYVEQRSRFENPEPDFGSRDFFRTPNRYGLTTLVCRNPRLVDVFLGMRYNGEMSLPHYAGWIAEDRLETSPPNWSMDASLSRSFSIGSDAGLTLTLGGKNLTNTYQDDLDRGPQRDSGYVWGPRFPRTLYVSTTVEF